MLDFLSYCLLIIVDTLGVFVICGGFLSVVNRLVRFFAGNFMSGILSFIGTPVHELGHVFMCALFGHKIEKVCLWNPHYKNEEDGYVIHSYNKKNPYQVLGNLFIGTGPILSGFLVIMLVIKVFYPEVFSSYIASALFGENLQEGLKAGFSAVKEILFSAGGGAGKIISIIISVLVISSVCLNISLSASDVKSCAGALPIYLILVVIFALSTYFFSIKINISNMLSSFFFSTLRLFMIVLCFEILLLIISIILLAIRKIFHR